MSQLDDFQHGLGGAVKLCEAPHPAFGVCTRERGHKGDHANPVSIWEQDVLRTPGSQWPATNAPTKVPDGMTNPKDLVGMTKPPLHLVPPAALIHMAMAMKDGAKKYGPYNWRQKKIQYTVYLAAAMRHLAQTLDGENLDPKSLVHHLGHAEACCGILLDAISIDMVIDDRPVKGAASKLIAEFTEKKQC